MSDLLAHVDLNDRMRATLAIPVELLMPVVHCLVPYWSISLNLALYAQRINGKLIRHIVYRCHPH